jgi:phytol kinase
MPGISIVIVSLVTLMVVVHRFSLAAETSRKAIHVGMGVICLAFPWLFSNSRSVDLLAVLAVTNLLFIRWRKPALGDVLHRIERLSIGELLFPIGVAIVFRLSDGDPRTYLPSIAILTFADTAGAIVGRRFGKTLYRTNAGQKSVEGSLAVFLVSFLIVIVSGISSDPLTNFLIAVVVSLVATMAEGILGAGTDNLVLPIAVFALIFILQNHIWPDLLARIALIAGTGLFLFCVRKLTSLNGGGLLSATVFAYLSFALGGPRFLIAPCLLFIIHLATTYRFQELSQMEHSADSISAVAIPGLIWVTLGVTTNIPHQQCYHGFCLTMMAQACFLHSATRKFLGKQSGVLVGAIKVLAVGAACDLWWFAGVAAIVLIPVIPISGNLTRPSQAILAFLFSLIALIL